MPITRRQFYWEIDPEMEYWMKKIHTFLSENKDAAFTREELSKALKVDTKSEEWEAWQAALERLAELFAVGKVIIRKTAYYAYNKERQEVLDWGQEARNYG